MLVALCSGNSCVGLSVGYLVQKYGVCRDTVVCLDTSEVEAPVAHSGTIRERNARSRAGFRRRTHRLSGSRSASESLSSGRAGARVGTRQFHKTGNKLTVRESSGALVQWEFAPSYGGGRYRLENGTRKPLDAVVKRICNVLASGAEAQYKSVAIESFELTGPSRLHEYAVTVWPPQMRRPVAEALLQF